MPGPTGTLVNQREVWLDKNNKPTSPGATDATRHMLLFYDNGEIWVSDWKPSQEWWQQGPLAPGQTSEQGQWAEPYYYSNEKQPPATSQWSLVERNGQTFRVNELTGESQPVPGLPTQQPSGGGSQMFETDQGIVGVNKLAPGEFGPQAPGELVWPDPNASLRKDLLQAQVAAAQRGPLGRQLTPAELQLQQLEVEKAQRSLMNPLLLAQQQLDEVINNLAQQYASGKISLQERDRMMGLIKQGYTAQMQGTTTAGKANVATNLLGNEAQLGGSLANSLMSGITGMAGKIMAGPTPLPNIDPFALARYGQSQLGAGPDITGMAKSLMTGFLQ